MNLDKLSKEASNIKENAEFFFSLSLAKQAESLVNMLKEADPDPWPEISPLYKIILGSLE